MSLGFVNKEGDFFVVKIQKFIFLMHGMTSKTIPHEYMPIGLILLI